MHRLLVYETDSGYACWRDSREGPWRTRRDAIEFAEQECGAAWAVVTSCGKVVAVGDHNGEIDPLRIDGSYPRVGVVTLRDSNGNTVGEVEVVV